MKELLGGRLLVRKGDITKMEADALVNAANSSLLGGGGVDGAIHRAGGPAILEECKKIRTDRYPEGLPAGEAVITSAGELPARYVIHTVGPVWHGGNKGEEEKLRSAYLNSLTIAAEKGLASLAFPAISTGVYGYPKDKAAVTAFGAIKAFIEGNKLPERVILVFFAEDDMKSFLKAVE